MSELPQSNLDSINALEKEKKMIDSLAKIEKLIPQIIQEDITYRTLHPEPILTKRQFETIFQEIKHSEEEKNKIKSHVPSAEFIKVIGDFVPYEERDTTKELYDLLPEEVKNKFTPEELWTKMDVFRFIDEARKETRKHWEQNSFKLLEKLLNLLVQHASSVFMTSLDGSASASEEGGLFEDKYRSIYFAFPLSNNTVMTKRFKMVMIRNHDLSKVIYEPSDVAIFRPDILKGIQGENSCIPKIGFAIEEFFSGMDLKNGDVPRKISSEEIKSGNFQHPWKNTHEGTTINKILFQR